jgi:hypothetical protein
MYAYCANNPIYYVDNDGDFGIPAIVAFAVTSAIFAAVVQIISNIAAGLKGREIFKGVLGSAIGSSVNATLLMSLWYIPNSMLIASLAGGITQALLEYLEDLLIWKTASVSDLGVDMLIYSASNLAGNFLGSKLIKVGSTWFQPKHFSAIFMGPFGQKLLAQSGIASLLNGIISFIRKKFKG